MDKYVSDGSTASYYVLPENARELQDLISHRHMNAQIGEIFRACYRYGECRHSDRLRDAKKILFYAQAEIERLEESLSLDNAHLNKILDAFAERGEDEEPPVPWDLVPEWARWMTRGDTGVVEAWEDKPVLCKPSSAGKAYWFVDSKEHLLGWIVSREGKKNSPMLWERP